MFRVREINDADRLPELRPDWRELLDQTAGADFFRTLDWLEVYWRHFGQEQTLRVLAIEKAGQPFGILPLVVRQHQTKIGSLKTLSYPLDYWGSFYGPIGPQPLETLRVGLQYIARMPRDWDFVQLRWIEEDPAETSAVAVAMEAAAMPPTRHPDEQIPVIDLTSGWDQYWGTRSRNWRSNCRRNERKLAGLGELEYVRYRPEGETNEDSDLRWDLFAQCEAIAKRSWQAASTDGTTITHDDVRDFIKDLHGVSATRGTLDLNLLTVAGCPAAFIYNYHWRGYISCLRLGFDPDFGGGGAGTVLMYRMLQDSFNRGDRVFDFLPGSLAAKEKWQTEVRCSEIYEFLPPQSGRVELLRIKHWLEDRVRRLRARWFSK